MFPGPARLCDPPVAAGSSPVSGGAESRASVTWIFTRQKPPLPPFPRRSDWTPRSTLVLAQRRSAGRSRTLLPPLPRSLSRETRRAPRRKFFSGSWKEAGREEPGRWMLLSCAAHASRERSAPGRAESLEDCSPQPEGGRGERSCPAAGAEEAAGRPAAAQAMPLRPLRHG